MRYMTSLYLKYFLRKLPKTVEICLKKSRPAGYFFVGVYTANIYISITTEIKKLSRLQLNVLNLLTSCLFVCLSGRLPQGKESGYPIRDLASRPREDCNRVCNWNSRLATFPDWPHSSRQVVLPGNQTCQFNPNTTITVVI